MVESFDGLQIQTIAPVDENMLVLDRSELWGFTLMMGEEDATFVIAGTKKKMKSHLEEDGSLLGLAYEAIRSSENILANELLDIALDDEQDIVMNGELFCAKEVKKLICRAEE